MIGNPKNKAWYSKSYRDFIKKQPVLISGQGQTVPHHLRIDNNGGTGLKPSDTFCIPLPKLVHDSFHAGTESDREFLERHNIDIYRELHGLVSLFLTNNKT